MGRKVVHRDEIRYVERLGQINLLNYKKWERRKFAPMVVNSSDIAAHVCVACIGDEITDTLSKQSGGTVSKDGVIGFIYEIAERSFVLRNHLRQTSNVGSNNGEVVGDCH